MSVQISKPVIYYNQYQKLKFLRYPGGKNRILKFIMPKLPNKDQIKGMYVEPFVGSGAVFFCLNPHKALLSDINVELIELLKGIKNNPSDVWRIFKNFPATKTSFYEIRSINTESKSLEYRSARILYINRTCFKGMWRYNKQGGFNVGYGGQDRRWAIDEENLREVSKRLKKASIKQKDFEEILDACQKGDFVFLDPPYSAGKKEMTDSHYNINQFSFDEHIRLSKVLKRASRQGVKWALTTSSHRDIKKLFSVFNIHSIPIGIGEKPGILSHSPGEVLINNYTAE